MIRYRCPTCGEIFDVERPQQAPYRPFCRERCQQIDLGKWLTGYYRVSEPIETGQGREGGSATDNSCMSEADK